MPSSRLKWFLTPLIVALALMISLGMAVAQTGAPATVQGNTSSVTPIQITPTVQSEISSTVDSDVPSGSPSYGIVQFTGRVEPGRGVIYDTGPMEKGGTLYFYARRISGNLDPMVGVFPGGIDRSVLAKELWGYYDKLIADGQDPISALSGAVDKYSLAWDDDSGKGYDAALAFEIPEDEGQYQILVTGSPGIKTFGNFELTTGLNAPDVLSGKATPTGTVDMQLQEVGVIQAVETVTGTLAPRNSEHYYPLVDLQQGETVRVYAEVISGTIKPVLTLRDFGDKPLAVANFDGANDTAYLEYTFPELATNYQLVIDRGGKNELSSRGDYELKFSRNVTDDLSSDVKPFGPPIRQEPISVRTVLRIDQVTDVDQVSENFSVVANLRFEWQDPLLAFSPDACDCSYIILRGERQLNDYLRDHKINRFPYFSLYNQQGARSTQNLIVLIQPNGNTTYFERFTGTFQAPDFDFRQFPFDTQNFYVRVQSLYSNSVFVYQPQPDESGFGDQLGEEEWIIEEFDTSVIDVNGRSQFVFHFPSRRHLNFYIFRILLPILLIIFVSWFSFFLKDYGRRVDVTSANLLIFVAYNFTIAGELPRLGYLTFMDFILISTFVVSALVIIVNVWFRRLEQSGQVELANRIDKIAIWLYPVFYIVGGVSVYLWFYIVSPYLKSR